MNKNIWIICKYAFPAKYFFGTRHFYLAEEWVKRGYNVDVFTSNSIHLTDKLPVFTQPYWYENINGIHVHWLNTVRETASGSFKRILSWIHFEWLVVTQRKKAVKRPDVVYVSSLSLLSVISGYLISKRYKAKFVFEVRDIWPLTAKVLGGYSRFHPFIFTLGLIEKWGYRKADLIVGTMPNHIAHVKRVWPGFKKWVCIPQGVNSGYYEHEQQKLTKEYVFKNVPTDKFVVVYAGTMNRNNPLDALVNAARILKHDHHINFLLIGSGDQKERLRRDTADLPNFFVLDHIEKRQIQHLLSFCSLCYDSIDSELAEFGLSRNKWIDYMMAAKPVICSYDGFQSMINEAECGSFVPYNDADALASEIRRYASFAPADLEAIGRRGRDFILQHRRFEKLAADFLDAIPIETAGR